MYKLCFHHHLQTPRRFSIRSNSKQVSIYIKNGHFNYHGTRIRSIKPESSSGVPIDKPFTAEEAGSRNPSHDHISNGHIPHNKEVGMKDNSNVPRMLIPEIFWFSSPPVALCLGRTCSADCSHKGTTSNPRHMDYSSTLAASLLNLSNSSRARSSRALYVYQTGDLAEFWRGLPLHFLVLF